VAVSRTHERYAVALGDGSGEIFVFDGRGGLRDRFGGRGRGPGEHRRITALLYDDRDSLFVFDAGNGRVSVYDPSHRFVRDFAMPGTVHHAAWAARESLVVQGRFQDGRYPEYRARLITPAGVTPIAREGGEQDLRSLEESTRPLTPSGRGGVWVGALRVTGARRFDGTGRAVDSLSVAAPWMEVDPENADVWRPLLDVRAAVLGLSEDPEGRLWFLVGVPPARLPRPPGDPARAIADGRLTPADLADHVLAVTDPAGGSRWLARRRFDFFSGGLLPGGLAYQMTEDELGERSILVERLRLTHRVGR